MGKTVTLLRLTARKRGVDETSHHSITQLPVKLAQPGRKSMWVFFLTSRTCGKHSELAHCGVFSQLLQLASAVVRLPHELNVSLLLPLQKCSHLSCWFCMASQFSLLFVSNALLYYTHLLLHAMGGQPRVGTYDCETASKREPLDRGYVDAILQGRRKWSSRKKKASLELPDLSVWPGQRT